MKFRARSRLASCLIAIAGTLLFLGGMFPALWNGTASSFVDVSAQSLFLFGILSGSLVLATQWIPGRHNPSNESATPELQQLNSWLSRFCENSKVGICWVDSDGIILSADQTQLDLLGYREEECVGQLLANFHADPSEFQATFDRLKRAETLPVIPARLRSRDGSLHEVLICTQVFFEGGEFHRACCVTIDLTQQRKTQNALEESEQRFQTLADSAPGLIWMSDLHRDSVYFNTFWLDFTGESEERLAGQGWLKCVHPEDREAVSKLRDESFSKQSSFTTEYRLRRADGTYRWMLDTGSPRFQPDGTFQGFAGSCVDITDRKRAEEAQSQLAAIVESSEDAIISMTLEGLILSWNAGAKKIYGYSADEMLGQPITKIIPQEMHAEENAILEKLRRGERIEHYETVRVGKQRKRIDISLTISPIRNAQGQIVAASKVARDVTADRRAKEELRRNEERFRELANNIDQFAWTCDETGGITWYNQRWYDFTGTTFEEMKGWGWTAVHHPDYLEQVVERIQHAFDNGLPWEDTFPLRGKDGNYRWFLSRAQPIRDKDGNVIRWFGTNTDITSELETEKALRESEEQFRTMANITPAILWTALPDGTVTWLSDRWYEYTAMSRQDDPQMWPQVLHPDEVEHCLQVWHRALRSGIPYEIEYRYRRHDGEYRWFLARANPVRDAENRIVSWCGSSTEIQNQKQMEQSQRFLAEASKSLSALVDYRSTLQVVAQLSIPGFADWCAVDILDEAGLPKRLAVAHVDPEKVPLAEELADRFREMTDAPRGVMKVIRTGKSDMSMLITDELIRQSTPDPYHRELLRKLSPCSYICVPLQAKNQCLGTLTFVTSESGRRYGLRDLEVAEDLAHRATIAIENARLYQEIQEAHRRKDEFLAMLAHELRNPLAPIRSGLDILAMNEIGDRETLRVMQDQVEHVVRLVDDLLDVSRIMRNRIELRKETVSLGTLIHRSVEAARQHIDNLDQELVVSLPEEPIWLEADPVRIIQVIENLLNNASKYTEEKGRIELAVERDAESVTIRLTDTGIGIESELLPNVFELFTQAERSLDRSQGGLGIGLTLVHRLVEMHNGTVTACSAGPNQGSTFTVRLPIAKRVPQDAEEVVKSEKAAQNRKIVVVDDNVGAATMLSKLFGKLGNHHVVTAHDGPSALDAVFETHPEIVLLDIGLPGMNGYQVAKAIRERPEFDDVLLVALTGYGQKEDRLRSKQAGFDEHRVKPPSVDQMKEILQHPKLGRVRNGQSPSAESNSGALSQRRAESHQTRYATQDDISSSSRAGKTWDVRQFKHDLGNVAHVLTLISELYLKEDANPDMIHQVQQGIQDEIQTIRDLMARLQHVIDGMDSNA